MPDLQRNGFSLVELVVVLLLVAILTGIAVPVYKKTVYRARAVGIVNDFHVVRAAAYQYSADHHTWPEDGYRGEMPPGLEPYLEGVDFEGEGYLLNFENFTYGDYHIVAISAHIEEPALETALINLLYKSANRFYHVDDRYTYLIAGPSFWWIKSGGGQ